MICSSFFFPLHLKYPISVHPCIYHGSHPECPVGAWRCRKQSFCQPVISQVMVCRGESCPEGGWTTRVTALKRRCSHCGYVGMDLSTSSHITHANTYTFIPAFLAATLGSFNNSRWLHTRWVLLLFHLMPLMPAVTWETGRPLSRYCTMVMGGTQKKHTKKKKYKNTVRNFSISHCAQGWSNAGEGVYTSQLFDVVEKLNLIKLLYFEKYTERTER